MARLDEQDFDEKRLARRQRRKQSQLIAYITLLCGLLVVAALVVFLVNSVRTLVRSSAPAGTVQEADLQAEESAETQVIETPEETEVPPEMTEEDMLNEIVESCISEMPLEDKVAGLFMITPEQLTGVDTAVKAGVGTQEALANYAVGGVIYSGKNIKNESQIKDMLHDTASMSKYPIFTAVSDTVVASAIGGAELPEITDSETARSAGSSIGSELFNYGFNLDIAPVIDISEEGQFGADKDRVKDLSANLIVGIQESGVYACAGRFPVAGDTASGMGIVDTPRDDLVTGEFSVFKNAIDTTGLDVIMVSNASFSGITGDNTPASLSDKVITGELRGTLGFEGVVVTAPLNEGAITSYYTSSEAAIEAISAGADIILVPENFKESYEGLLEAVQNGKISEERVNESLRRIYRIKYADRVSQITDN
jgi:beta-N-acetylhexosaminidase